MQVALLAQKLGNEFKSKSHIFVYNGAHHTQPKPWPENYAVILWVFCMYAVFHISSEKEKTDAIVSESARYLETAL